MRSSVCISKKIVQSTRSLTMSPTARLLYFDLLVEADDDGVVEAFKVLRLTGANKGDLEQLIQREFVIILEPEELITYLPDWRDHNPHMRADRKEDSIYLNLLLKILPETSILCKKERSDIKKNKVEKGGPSTDRPRAVQMLSSGPSMDRPWTAQDNTIQDNTIQNKTREYNTTQHTEGVCAIPSLDQVQINSGELKRELLAPNVVACIENLTTQYNFDYIAEQIKHADKQIISGNSIKILPAWLKKACKGNWAGAGNWRKDDEATEELTELYQQAEILEIGGEELKNILKENHDIKIIKTYMAELGQKISQGCSIRDRATWLSEACRAAIENEKGVI